MQWQDVPLPEASRLDLGQEQPSSCWTINAGARPCARQQAKGHMQDEKLRSDSVMCHAPRMD